MYSKNDLKVSVDKGTLVAKMQVNRAQHAADYEKAKKGFRKLLIEELEEKLEDAKNGESVSLRFEANAPESHLEDYDDVIDMLHMANDGEIELSHVQFKQWVQDKWDWKEQWGFMNAVSLSAAPDEE
jgi:hypothetical protein